MASDVIYKLHGPRPGLIKRAGTFSRGNVDFDGANWTTGLDFYPAAPLFLRLQRNLCESHRWDCLKTVTTRLLLLNRKVEEHGWTLRLEIVFFCDWKAEKWELQAKSRSEAFDHFYIPYFKCISRESMNPQITFLPFFLWKQLSVTLGSWYPTYN